MSKKYKFLGKQVYNQKRAWPHTVYVIGKNSTFIFVNKAESRHIIPLPDPDPPGQKFAIYGWIWSTLHFGFNDLLMLKKCSIKRAFIDIKVYDESLSSGRKSIIRSDSCKNTQHERFCMIVSAFHFNGSNLLSLKVLTNEKRGGLNVVAFDRFPCYLRWDFQTSPLKGLELLSEACFCHLKSIIASKYIAV